jgi:hypothetical protein
VAKKLAKMATVRHMTVSAGTLDIVWNEVIIRLKTQTPAVQIAGIAQALGA